MPPAPAYCLTSSVSVRGHFNRLYFSSWLSVHQSGSALEVSCFPWTGLRVMKAFWNGLTAVLSWALPSSRKEDHLILHRLPGTEVQLGRWPAS